MLLLGITNYGRFPCPTPRWGPTKPRPRVEIEWHASRTGRQLQSRRQPKKHSATTLSWRQSQKRSEKSCSPNSPGDEISWNFMSPKKLEGATSVIQKTTKIEDHLVPCNASSVRWRSAGDGSVQKKQVQHQAEGSSFHHQPQHSYARRLR